MTPEAGASFGNEMSGAPFESACPETGEPCPSRSELIELHGYGSKRTAEELARMSAQTALRGCAGPGGDNCPTREAMDKSPARRVAVIGVSGLRRVFARNDLARTKNWPHLRDQF